MNLKPVISTNSNISNLNQVNDMVRSLNKEQQIKTFKGTSGSPAVTIGKYMPNRYGMVISDVDGAFRRILIGQHPIDGRAGSWVSKAGIDVINELSS